MKNFLKFPSTNIFNNYELKINVQILNLLFFKIFLF